MLPPPAALPDALPELELDPLLQNPSAATQLFLATFHATPAAQTISDLHTGVVIDTNAAACQATGYSRAETIGRNTAELNMWADPQQLLGVIATLQRAGSIQDAEIRVRTRSGEERIQLCSFAVMRIDDRDLVVGTALDITERKRAEEQQRALMQSLQSAIAVVDNEGRLHYVNDLMATLLRAGSAAAPVGATLFDLFPRFRAQNYLDLIHHATHTGEPHSAEGLTEIFGDPRWYRVTVQPICEQSGACNRVLVNFTDIHALKMAQQELEELARTLEQRVLDRTAEVADLYEHAPAGYHSLDREGRYVRVNQTELQRLGYTAEEVLGRRFTDFLSEESRRIFAERYPRFLEEGSAHDIIFDVVTKDGAILPILLSATALYDETGAFVMSRATLVDITERRQAEAALRQANAEMEHTLLLRDQFLANMSHELRTPLNTILTLNEILHDGLYGAVNDHQARLLREVETSSRHLLSLINDLLDLAKIDAGRLELEHQLLSANELCEASLIFVKQAAARKNIELTFVGATPDLRLHADGRRLKQMLVNLLDNAVKFTLAGGRVALRVAPDPAGSTIQFVVQDTGIGIGPDDLPRLFHRFVQLDGTLARGFSGAGLGLALVKRLAEQHGGAVTAASAGIAGQGSTFTISLPAGQPQGGTNQNGANQGAADQPPAAPAGTPLSAAAQPAGHAAGLTGAELAPARRPHILLVEDNEPTVNAMLEYLRFYGYQVTVARTGPEAIAAAAAQGRPDLILMDIQLPQLDGLAVTRLLRQDPRFADTPIIATTALAYSYDRERCLAAGATAYLSKPTAMRDLIALVQQLLAPLGFAPSAPPPSRHDR